MRSKKIEKKLFSRLFGSDNNDELWTTVYRKPYISMGSSKLSHQHLRYDPYWIKSKTGTNPVFQMLRLALYIGETGKNLYTRLT